MVIDLCTMKIHLSLVSIYSCGKITVELCQASGLWLSHEVALHSFLQMYFRGKRTFSLKTPIVWPQSKLHSRQPSLWFRCILPHSHNVHDGCSLGSRLILPSGRNPMEEGVSVFPSSRRRFSLV